MSPRSRSGCSATTYTPSVPSGTLLVVARADVKPDIPNYPANAEAQMIENNDFAWAAANRERILAEWSKRYDAKSEAKK